MLYDLHPAVVSHLFRKYLWFRVEGKDRPALIFWVEARWILGGAINFSPTATLLPDQAEVSRPRFPSIFFVKYASNCFLFWVQAQRVALLRKGPHCFPFAPLPHCPGVSLPSPPTTPASLSAPALDLNLGWRLGFCPLRSAPPGL